MLDSPFVRDVKKNWIKIFGVAIIVAWAAVCWVAWDRHTATIFVWGAVWGGIVFLILSTSTRGEDESEEIESSRWSGQSGHFLISNENITDARIVGRVFLAPGERLGEVIEDMAIVPDLKHEPDGWKIMNFRLVPRTQVETRPIEEIFKGGSQ